MKAPCTFSASAVHSLTHLALVNARYVHYTWQVCVCTGMQRGGDGRGVMGQWAWASTSLPWRDKESWAPAKLSSSSPTLLESCKGHLRCGINSVESEACVFKWGPAGLRTVGSAGEGIWPGRRRQQWGECAASTSQCPTICFPPTHV